VIAAQEEGLTEQRNQLSTRICIWEKIQPLYMPGLLQYQSNIHGQDGIPLISTEQPEDVDLELPSQVPKELRQKVFAQSLPAIEEKLRMVQCYDALDSLRHILKIKSRLIKFKDKNI
jgi:hypothetical protein